MTKQDETLRIVRNMHGGNAHDDNCPACREIKAREAEGVPMIPPSERPESLPLLETTRQAIIDALVKNGVIGARQAVDRLIEAAKAEERHANTR